VNYTCLKTLEVLIVLVEHKCAKDAFILNLDKTDNFVLKRFSEYVISGQLINHLDDVLLVEIGEDCRRRLLGALTLLI